MANAIAPNIVLNSLNEQFHAAWKLTRTLLAAGWKYKASSDTAVKETSGSPETDRWANQGYINLTSTGNTGSAASITTVTNNVATVTGLSGLTAASVGRALRISGAANTNNIGTFRIVTQSGTSATVFMPGGVASDANNGAITWTEFGGGATASVTTVTNGIATVTGLTGMVVPSGGSPGSTGHTLTITGAASGGNNGTFQVQTVIDATSVTIINPSAVASDANNGAIVWTENDPLSQVYPPSITGASAIGAWIVLQGPSTLKLTIGTNTPSTTFRRGEKVTQSTTGAEGEILGVVTDSGGGGYIVVAPRVNGNGGGAKGWSATGAVTAVAAPVGSGASVTPTGVTEFIRELVFWKASATQGHVYYQCINTATEVATTATTGRFSTMAALGTATLTICPGGATGGSPVTNGFPTIGTMCCLGTGGSGAATTSPNSWNVSSTSNVSGKFHCMVANAIEATGASPDGSFTFALGTPGIASSSFNGWGWSRCDDGEDGDVDPYIFYIPTTTSNYGRARTANPSPNALGNNHDAWMNGFMTAANYTPYMGFRRRGYASAGVANGDAYQEFQGFLYGTTSSATGATQLSLTDTEKVACAYVVTRVREPLTIASMQTGQKMRKGTPRWWYSIQGGNGTDTLDGKRWLQLSGGQGGAGAFQPAIVAGPWDQTSVAFNG